MRKILLLSSLLVIFMFLVSCAPPLTDEELEAELAKLTPEEREELLKELEGKEGSALAGQAIDSAVIKLKLPPKVVSVPIARIRETVNKVNLQTEIALIQPTCTDSDPEDDSFKKGKVEVKASLDDKVYTLNYYDECQGNSVKQYSCPSGSLLTLSRTEEYKGKSDDLLEKSLVPSTATGPEGTKVIRLSEWQIDNLQKKTDACPQGTVCIPKNGDSGAYCYVQN